MYDDVTYIADVLHPRMAGVPEGTVLLTNLPYGKRLQHAQVCVCV